MWHSKRIVRSISREYFRFFQIERNVKFQREQSHSLGPAAAEQNHIVSVCPRMHKSKFIDCQQQKRRRTTKQFIIMPYMGCHTCTHTSGTETENRSSVQHTDRKIYLISTISIQILGVDGISDINKLLLRIFDRFWLGPGDFVFENIDNLSVLCYSTAWHRVAWHREGDKSCVKIFECVKFQSFGSRLWNTVTVFCLCKICWEISAVDIVCIETEVWIS